jgi:4-hydroxy-tetrahydrodipicolinate reductase
MIKVGLFGLGKAGLAVANVVQSDPRFTLCWVAKRSAAPTEPAVLFGNIPVVALNTIDFDAWMDEHPVDAIVDFSSPEALHVYGRAVQERELMVVSAISAYSPEQIAEIRSWGQYTRVLHSPNMTLGINFLIMAAKLLKSIAPFADVEILEQHFKEKPEVSGTARKIAESLSITPEKITSMRLGGIVGHHEVIFGFPYQTVRLTHDSIRREAFGTGAMFALQELSQCDKGSYTFDDLLMKKIFLMLSAHNQSAAV